MKSHLFTLLTVIVSMISGLAVGVAVALYFSFSFQNQAVQLEVFKNAKWQLLVLSELKSGRTPHAESILQTLAESNLVTLKYMRRGMSNTHKQEFSRLMNQFDQLKQPMRVPN
jgi:uncharacterized membrane protein YraQ (UPF0718 family)